MMEEVEVFGAAKAEAGEPRSERSERSGSSAREALGAPDPEVVAVAKRRSFTREYKMRIVEEADRCGQAGEVGMLLAIPLTVVIRTILENVPETRPLARMLSSG